MRGVFFCYALPALDKEKREFTEEAGTTRWYLYDLDRETILEEPGQIVASVRSKPGTPRRCTTEEKTLLHIRKRIEKHIKKQLPEARGRPRRRQAADVLLDGAERGLSRRCRPTTANALRASGASTQLVAYLRDELGWPIDSDDFEELTFEYTPAELGIDAKNAAKIQEIKRLRPLSTRASPGASSSSSSSRSACPWWRCAASSARWRSRSAPRPTRPERQAWAADDLLFVSNYGEGEERRIAYRALLEASGTATTCPPSRYSAGTTSTRRSTSTPSPAS